MDKTTKKRNPNSFLLGELKKLQPGDPFLYQGQPAEVVWSQTLREFIWNDKEGHPVYWNHFGLYFQVFSEPLEVAPSRGITFVSGWPHDTVELDDFTYGNMMRGRPDWGME